MKAGRMRFQDQVFLITGAGAGICRAAIGIIAAEGGKIAAFDRDAAAVAGTIAMVREAGSEGLEIAGDALSEADAARAVAATLEKFGRIDVLINGVGGSTIVKNGSALLEEFSLEEWEGLIDNPGLTMTGRIVKVFGPQSEEVHAERLSRIPLGRYSLPEDQAKVVCFLASSDADFITGIAIDVTGGQ